MNKSINIIVAVDINYGFGKDGKIPWHYPEDFKFFKTKTTGSVMIMGRKTFDDLLTYSKGSTIMPDRRLIVLTSSALPEYDNIEGASDISSALEIASKYNNDVFLIGGELVFTKGLSLADTVYLTMINKDYECDRFFPYELLMHNFNLLQSRQSEAHPNELVYKTFTHKGFENGSQFN